MTTRKTTALILGIFLGIAVAAWMIWALAPLELVYLRDDFSDRTIMKDDPKEPAPKEKVVVFFPPAEMVEERIPVPVRPAEKKPERPSDPLQNSRTRPGAYDRLTSK